MKSFRNEICSVCRGERYPRQCRGSAAWRAHKVALFDDLDAADFDCPCGLSILPDSNAVRGGRPRTAPKARPRKRPCVYAEFKLRRPCCGNYYLCTNPNARAHGLVLSGRKCRKECADREPLCKEPPMNLPRLSMIITARDEDHAEVLATLRSAAAAYPADRLEIILVDDGSKKPLADVCASGEGLQPFATQTAAFGGLRLIRHQEPQGVGRARNAGFREATGEVVSFHDAHMRFPLADELASQPVLPNGEQDTDGLSALEVLARRAGQGSGIICSATRDTRPDRKFWATGCDLFCNRRDGLQPKWRFLHRENVANAYERVACPMGAGYFLWRVTADRLAGATGQLWEDTAGRWGFSEQALAVKAYLLNIGVYAARDVYLRHLYRSVNPMSNAGKELWWNVVRATYVLMPDEAWRLRYRPWCLKRMDESELDAITAEAEGARVRLREKHGDAYDSLAGLMPERLFGKNAMVTARHPDHEWTPDLYAALAALKTRPTPLHILQWRPGESTLLLRDLCEHAVITCIERPGARRDDWFDVCRAAGVELKSLTLGPNYTRWPIKNRPKRGYDLVIVGGELQEECLATAEKVLAEGGRIVRNHRADRMLLEDNERRKEAAAVAAVVASCEKRQQPRQEGEAAPAPVVPKHRTSLPAATLTVCLLNYRRPQNIPAILDCLAAQTLRPTVWLWDNAPRGEGQQMRSARMRARLDLRVVSGRNFGCFPRWWLASMAETDYVCSMDDDLVLRDERVLADAVEAQRSLCPDGVVGFFGWKRVEGRQYKGSRHIHGSREDRRVDLVKGRFMVLRRTLLERVPLLARGVGHREDDVLVNLGISGGRPGAHLVPGVLGKRWKELPQRGTALAAEPGHYNKRDQAIRAMLDWLAAQGRLAPEVTHA